MGIGVKVIDEDGYRAFVHLLGHRGVGPGPDPDSTVVHDMIDWQHHGPGGPIPADPGYRGAGRKFPAFLAG